MARGHGDPDLVGAVDGPTVRDEDAALLGGQVLDEAESRMLASSGVAHFGAGMLGGPAGLAALDAWARTVATRVDGCYIAFDMDVLDAADGWALTMPEPDGISIATAIAAVRLLADALPIDGIGLTAMTIRAETPAADIERTIDAVAALTETALGIAEPGRDAPKRTRPPPQPRSTRPSDEHRTDVPRRSPPPSATSGWVVLLSIVAIVIALGSSGSRSRSRCGNVAPPSW